MIIIVTSCRPAASFEQTTPDTERARVTMRTRSFADMSCSIAGALELVGDRWTLLIVRDLLFGLSRFDDLQRSTGIPPQTLADRLRRLDVLRQHQHCQLGVAPPRFERRPDPLVGERRR